MRFSGHETFICKQFWLKKGYDFLLSGKKFGDATAVVELGVGKNMVGSISHWMKAFGICNDKWELTEFGNYILNNEGKDPYLESIGTLWLLHYELVKQNYASLYNLFFNDFRRGRYEFTTQQFCDYVKIKLGKYGGYNDATIKTDVSVFQRMYLQPILEGNSEPDEVYASIFNELQLLSKIKVQNLDNSFSDIYRFLNEEKKSLPAEVILYSILDQYTDETVSFKELEVGYNSPGTIFALDKNGLISKIEEIIDKYSQITFSSTAGVQELQFNSPINKWDVLDNYYANN